MAISPITPYPTHHIRPPAPNARLKRDPFLEALDNEDLERVRQLSADPACYDGKHWLSGNSYLEIAAGSDSEIAFEACKLLVANRADVNKPSDYSTPLHQAASNCSSQAPKICQFLIEKKAVVDGKDPFFKSTALTTASSDSRRNGNLVVLLGAGADPNARRTRWSDTALMGAIEARDEAACKLLLGAKADANLSGECSVYTHLMKAVSLLEPSIVRTLIKEQADVNGKNSFGSTVFSSLFFQKADRRFLSDSQIKDREERMKTIGLTLLEAKAQVCAGDGAKTLLELAVQNDWKHVYDQIIKPDK